MCEPINPAPPVTRKVFMIFVLKTVVREKTNFGVRKLVPALQKLHSRGRGLLIGPPNLKFGNSVIDERERLFKIRELHRRTRSAPEREFLRLGRTAELNIHLLAIRNPELRRPTCAADFRSFSVMTTFSVTISRRTPPGAEVRPTFGHQ